MKYSVEEKRKYHANGRPKGEFSQGYLIGVVTYRSYGKKGSPVHKQARKKYIDNVNAQAKAGDLYSKGIMCAYRDCANERKERQKKK